MVSSCCHSVNGVLSLVFVLTGCLTTTCNALTEYGRADENVTLPVTTSLQGELQGVNMLTRLNRTVYGFKSIPYGEPPVGDLRFKAPVAASAWNGTFNASNNAEACPQISYAGVLMGNEDCLYVHVYTPKLPDGNNSTLLPVIVFIFGGKFQWGFADPLLFGPQFLLEEDVVVVVPNFRVGLLGFLTTGDEVAPGNNGLKDIVLALQWVQDNIQYFGGDPNQVTLAGHSSGAMGVSYLVATAATKGLFQKVITHSGAAFSSELNVPVEVHVNHTIQLAEHFGCPTGSSTLLINCLRDVDALKLANTTSLFYVWHTLPSTIWSPVVETDIEGALLTDTIENLYAAGKIPDVPWLSLLAESEGYISSMMFYTNADLFDEFLEKIDWILPYYVGYYWTSDDTVSAYTAALKSFYLNDLTADRRVLLDNVTDMMGDALFNYPAYHSLRYQLAVAENPVWFAFFKYRGVLSKTYTQSNGWTNFTEATHGDEMLYIFESLYHNYAPPGEDYDEDDFSMVETMVGIWASFATNGIPTAVHRNGTITWEPYTSSLKNYLRIGNATDISFGTEYDLQKERIEFWDEMLSSTSGEPRNQIQSLTILFCSVLWLAVFRLSNIHGH